MKHQNEKQSEHAMRFFTPELYVRFNSADDKEADQANEEWESALDAYQKHLVKLRDRMSSPVKDLAAMCLHDAELLACDQKVEPFQLAPDEISSWSAFGILSLKQNDTITTLIYVLWDRIRENPAPVDWSFSDLRKHWLYDEMDLGLPIENRFVHRILFSDGVVMEVPFVAVVMHTFPAPKTGDTDATKQSA